MKRRYIKLLVGVFVLLSACSPSEEAIARALEQTREADRATLTAIAETQEAIPTNTPTQTKTPKPTPTVTPPPLEELLNITLELADLPGSFIKIDPAEMDLPEEEILSYFIDVDMTTGDIFAFFNEEDFNVIMGFSVFINNRIEQSTFDILINNYGDELLAELVAGVGEETTEQYILNNLDKIGDSSIGLYVVVEIEDTPLDLAAEVLMFRRDIVVPYIMNMYIKGETPAISIHELGMILDNKILDALGQ